VPLDGGDLGEGVVLQVVVAAGGEGVDVHRQPIALAQRVAGQASDGLVAAGAGSAR
jgi:hypothetical protein